MPTLLSTKRMITAMVLVATAFAANAGDPVSKSFLTGIAIGGHDTVAYHKVREGEPHQAIKGNKTWIVKWKDADWLFTNEADSRLFAADPQRYAPAYNGYCANALSLGEGLIKTDGTQWQIFGDQLYTFYAARGRERWLDGNFTAYKAVADQAWKDIVNGE